MTTLTRTATAGPSGFRPPTGQIRVVLADDSPEVRELVRMALEEDPAISVEGEAADGAEALAVVDAIRPDAVLLDVAMPVMDGLDALREIRARYGDAVAVVVWSGFSATHIAERAVQMGASAYIEKSGDLHEVVAALKAVGCDRARPSGPAPARTAGSGPAAGSSPAAGSGPAAASDPAGSGPAGSGPAVDVAPPADPDPAPSARQQPRPGPVPAVERFRMRSSVLRVGVAVVMFAGIFAWRAVDPNPDDRVAELYVLPVLLLAVQYGVRGGFAGAAVATSLFIAYASPHGVGAVGYFSSLASFLVAGATVGWYSDQTQRIARLRERDRNALAAANRRLASAVESSRSVNATLAETNADLRQFMHVASHDLAEPLRTMSGFAELVDSRYRDQLDDRGRKFLSHIVDGASRMQGLLDDLMAYTRASQHELRRDEVDLNRVVDSVVAALAARIKERDAVVRVPHPLPVATGDASMLGLVLQNLISNAIKFNDSHPPVVHITASVVGPTVSLAVADNGIGIPPEHHERVFALFQRLHTRSEYPGSGLGLAICRRIVDRHGGNISMTSEPGRGTTFVIELPAGART